MSVASETQGILTYLKRRKGEYFTAYEIGRTFRNDKKVAERWAASKLDTLVKAGLVDQQETYFGVKP